MIPDWMYYSAVVSGAGLMVVTLILGRKYGEERVLEALKKAKAKGASQ